MASEHLICTHHQRHANGTRTHRSTFLDSVDTTRVSSEATAKLLSTHQTLPPGLADTLTEEACGGTEPNATRENR